MEEFYLWSLLLFLLFHEFLYSFLSLCLEEIEKFAKTEAATTGRVLDNFFWGSSDSKQLPIFGWFSFYICVQKVSGLIFIAFIEEKHWLSISLNLISKSFILKLQFSVLLHLFWNTNIFFIFITISLAALLVES